MPQRPNLEHLSARERPPAAAIRNGPLVRRLAAYVRLSEKDLGLIDRFDRNQRSFGSGAALLLEGEASPPAFILSQGWAMSYKILRGGGRQIVAFHIPGDFLGLRSVLFRSSDHTLEAVTPITAVEFGACDLFAAFGASSRLTAAVLWAASSDEALVVERLVSLGRRNALERTAHFLLELGARLKLVGLAGADGYDCPLSQFHLSDALGLSAVHVNRVLRQLREDGLLTFRHARVRFDDVERLISVAGFDAAYLDHDGPLMNRR